jgi:predicted ATPase
MRVKKIYINGYKNLNSFEASFESGQTVIIGQNASGKSNLLEALIIIFKNLDYGYDPEFAFKIHYEIKNKEIVIIGDNSDNNQRKYSIWHVQETGRLFESIDEQIDLLFSENKLPNTTISLSFLRNNKQDYLPKHVFVYYSGLGNSNRLEDLLYKPDKDFALALVKNTTGKEPEDRRFFYARLHHSQSVLLSFYALDLEDEVKEFMSDNLKINNLDTITFILKKPSWKSKGGDPIFWGSKGVVSAFLNDLYEIATAPLRDERPFRIDLWKSAKEKRLILHISSIKKIKDLVKLKKWTNIQFFNILESINASHLQREIKIRIRKHHDGAITFKDLSEGEQQLLTVLGLMRFTRYDESLYLLDEPDTHLNPLWRWKYMDFIKNVAGKPSTSQVIMTSHDPFTIGSLCREDVRVFKTDEFGRAVSYSPTVHPRGMGTAGITIEIFGLPTTLDMPTQEELDEQRDLQSRVYFDEELSPEQHAKLTELNIKLSNLGYSHVYRDPLFQKFEMRFAKEKRAKGIGIPQTPEEVEELNQLATDLLDELFNE